MTQVELKACLYLSTHDEHFYSSVCDKHLSKTSNSVILKVSIVCKYVVAIDEPIIM